MLIDWSPLRKYRDYRLLFIGQMVSMFGSMVTYVAIPYQVYQLTHSSFLVGLLGIVQLVPLALFALWGGALADVMDRRRLLIISEAILAVAAVLLAVNGFMAEPRVWLVFGVAGLMSAVNGFHRPALEAMTQQLVPSDGMAAVGALGSFRYSVSAIAGPALGGICMAQFGIASTYLIDAATFAVSIAALALMKPVPKVSDAGERLGLASVVEGLRYAQSRPVLIGTYVVDIIAMTFAMPMALFPAMAKPWGGEVAAGWLYAAMSIGSLAVTILSGWTGNVMRHGAGVILAAALWGVAVVALGFAPSLPMAVLCLALAGAADSVSGIFRFTIWNETIPQALRGRLASIEMLSYMSGPLLGNARAGYVALVSTNELAIVSGGLICVAMVLLCIPLLPAFWMHRSSKVDLQSG